MNSRITLATCFGLALSGLAASAAAVTAVPDIVLDPNTINFFRDIRGTNNVGVPAGDVWQFGGNITGGSSGAFVSATSPDGSFTTNNFVCTPLSTSPNFCSGGVTFNPARLGAWTLNFTRPGFNPLNIAAPSALGTDVRVPFPNNVTITGAGVNPTISWQLPAGYTPDGFRVQIFDRSRILANGLADIIYSAALANGTTSLTIPTNLGGGRQLTVGGNYAINFQVIETRNDLAFGGNNGQILSRSNSYFAFTPQAAGASGPPSVFLPEVIPDTNPLDNRGPVYQFRIGGVGPNSVTFIDPIVAVGYDYATAVGDPNFASVTLPSVGDNLFDLSYLLNGTIVHQSLQAGVQFFFQQGGVNAFSVRGIETSAGLDPNNANAFITGLTFAGNGAFNGTMTAIVADVPVPVPASLGLVLAGIFSWSCVRASSTRRTTKGQFVGSAPGSRATDHHGSC